MMPSGGMMPGGGAMPSGGVMRPLDLWLIRHAPSIHDEGVVPPYDPDADLSDVAGFERMARLLPPAAVWWVSPLKRCRMTADMLIASGAEAASVRVDERLTEQNYGRFHGRDVAAVWDEVKDGARSNWHFLHPSFCPPDGESFLMFHGRTAPVLKAIEGADLSQPGPSHPGPSNLVVVGHAMLFKSLIAHAFDIPPGQALALAIEPLSLSRLTLIRPDATRQDDGGRWSLKALNITPIGG